MPPRSGASSASMQTNASSFASSWLGSSPSRQSPTRGSPVTNGLRTPARDSPLRATATSPIESPSQRLILEFSQMLIRSDENFTAELDQVAAEQAKRYQAQLSKAASEHGKVRTEAELERRRLVEEEESRQRKREAELRRQLEAQAEAKAKEEAEERQRQAEAKRREEETARQAAEQQRKIQEAEAQRKAQQDKEEAARKQQQQREAEARKAKEASEAAHAAAKAQAQAPAQAPPAPQPSASAPATASPAPAAPSAATTAASIFTPAATIEEIHSRYLELHQRMKAFWKPFKSTCSQKGHPLKETVGDLRRGIRKTVGQVSVSREDSKVTITKLREMLRQCRDAGGPTIDIRPFIISHPLPTISNEAEAQYPALLLYAFICIEKAALTQFGTEAASDDGRVIAELGAIVASLFVDKEFNFKGTPLVDLMLAKWHKVCPILFGIRGNLTSQEGLLRLGVISGGEQLTLNNYHERMQGLASGYAAMSLRAVPVPAIPMSEYWRALSQICNTPSDALYSGHYYVLKGLIRYSAMKFMQFYGMQGRAALRYAVTVVPKRSPARAKDAANIVEVLPDAWKASKVYV